MTVSRTAVRHRTPRRRGRANRCRVVARRFALCAELFECVELNRMVETVRRQSDAGAPHQILLRGPVGPNARREARMTYGKANASRKAIPRKEGICWGGIIVERGRALKMHLGLQSANTSS